MIIITHSVSSQHRALFSVFPTPAAMDTNEKPFFSLLQGSTAPATLKLSLPCSIHPPAMVGRSVCPLNPIPMMGKRTFWRLSIFCRRIPRISATPAGALNLFHRVGYYGTIAGRLSPTRSRCWRRSSNLRRQKKPSIEVSRRRTRLTVATLCWIPPQDRPPVRPSRYAGPLCVRFFTYAWRREVTKSRPIVQALSAVRPNPLPRKRNARAGPSAVFWIVPKHGSKMSGMPRFGGKMLRATRRFGKYRAFRAKDGLR